MSLVLLPTSYDNFFKDAYFSTLNRPNTMVLNNQKALESKQTLVDIVSTLRLYNRKVIKSLLYELIISE